MRGQPRALPAAKGNTAIVALTYFWEEFYERMWELHRRIGGDIPGTFGELQRGGHLEIITCAATHGYLPLLSADESIHLQLRTAVETHKRHFGQAPRGIWLPECAYRPRYEWTPPTGPDQGSRAATYVPGSRRCWPRTVSSTSWPTRTWWRPASPSSSIATTCAAQPARDVSPSPLPVSAKRSPYAPYRVASRGGTGSAVAFIRDPRTTLQVWSREQGYPGEFQYLEFHKKHHPAGFASGASPTLSSDLGTKQLYDPKVAAAEGRAAGHATSWSWCRRPSSRPAGRRPGWCARPTTPSCSATGGSKGPPWLEQVGREMAQERRARR